MSGGARWWDVAFGVVVGVLASTALVAALLLVIQPPQGEPIRLVPPTPESLKVHVTGAVRRPGVYTLPLGSRVVDALQAAGGARADAALEAVNLAQPLEDGQRLWIPSREESALTPDPDNLISSDDSPSEVPTPFKLNLNQASAEALETLPGIGPVLAQRIVAYREEHGPFQTVEDLLEVKGIGPVLLEKIRPYVYVGSPSLEP